MPGPPSRTITLPLYAADLRFPQSPQPLSGTADRRLRRDLRTLAVFITMYCRARHRGRTTAPVAMKTHDVERLAGRPVELCRECARLLQHSWIKRTTCPFDPKPACKHCPSHCYHPTYRRQIRRVMRDSGRRLVLHGRLDYLLKLLF